VVYTQNADQDPTPNGADVVWPGPGAGIESFTATDRNFVYVAGQLHTGEVLLPAAGFPGRDRSVTRGWLSTGIRCDR
jgi:hypothetical protein